MPLRKRSDTTIGHAKTPEAYSNALANVWVEAEHDAILGQAWLAGKNQLVTCGHVVEMYVEKPQELVVKFPATGNRYRVAAIKLHPSFVRQKDQLVKFDAAVLEVELHRPETEVEPMPIKFEQPIEVNQSVVAVRYPAHLGLITAAPNPLSQRGHILGTLRKHDPFHLLHDLALAQGDSGSPILRQGSVVAIHCGDTASLPGLNLPTTSIRLALWIDALRELGIKPTAQSGKEASLADLRNWHVYAELTLAFLLSCALTIVFLLASAAALESRHNRWRVDPIIPPRLAFSVTKVANEKGAIEALRLKLRSGSDGRAVLFLAYNQGVLVDSPFVRRIELKSNQEVACDWLLNSGAGQSAPPVRLGKPQQVCLIVTATDLNFTGDQGLGNGLKMVPMPDFLSQTVAFEAAHPGKAFHQIVETGR